MTSVHPHRLQNSLSSNNRPANHERLSKIRRKKNQNRDKNTAMKAKVSMLMVAARWRVFRAKQAANPQGLNPEPGPKSPHSFLGSFSNCC